MTDPEITFLLSEVNVEYLVARGYYDDAFNAIENLSASLRGEGSDILQRISMLLAKAELFGRAGMPERGFSIALRAASVSFKARLMPCLWSAVGILSNILNSMGEFEAAAKLLHATIPQVWLTQTQRYNWCPQTFLGGLGTKRHSTYILLAVTNR